MVFKMPIPLIIVKNGLHQRGLNGPVIFEDERKGTELELCCRSKAVGPTDEVRKGHVQVMSTVAQKKR